MATREPRLPCPACGRRTAVVRATERMRRHAHNGTDCPGSDRRIDLYGGNR